MPALETIEIRSPKNSTQKWIINQVDYDAAIHVLWSEPNTEPQPDVGSSLVPSVDDFTTDERDGSEWVNIINPENQRARMKIPASEYDPDLHRLWSTHSRFRR